MGEGGGGGGEGGSTRTPAESNRAVTLIKLTLKEEKKVYKMKLDYKDIIIFQIRSEK